MQSFKAGSLPSSRRQHLLSEFSGLRQACPEGIFVSLTPGDPALWSAVLFVRDGAYAPAVLRFQMFFADSYPRLPPLITFHTDMFHPLITPLTTYMYTTDIQDNGTVSATDDERLPPGGFNLRHGFPDWFGRGRRSAAGSRQTSGQQASSSVGDPVSPGKTGPATDTPDAAERTMPSYMQTNIQSHSMYDVFRYLKSTFDDDEVLDSVPLSAAGNPGAWHAWRTHRRKGGKGRESETKERSEQQDGKAIQEATGSGQDLQSKGPGAATARHPGEWNWDGVWEDRVKKGIAVSLSEPALYGTSGSADDLIRFLPMEENDIDSVKENIQRSLGSAA